MEIAAHVDLPENGQLWQNLREGSISGFMECLNKMNRSLAIQSLMKHMLMSDANNRPNAMALLAHPLVQAEMKKSI